MFLTLFALNNYYKVRFLPNYNVFFFSVIVVVYNKEQYLNYSIPSIYAQKFSRFEVLIIDDHSTDRSKEKIQEYQKKHPNMKLFSLKRNRGILYGRQLGIKQSTGKYIFMLDPDDMFENQIFHYCYTILKTEKYDIVDFKAHMLNGTKVTEFLIQYRPPNNLKRGQILELHKNNRLYRNMIMRCVRRSTYMLALKFLGDEILNRFVVCSEDFLLFTVILCYTNNIYFTSYYGYRYSLFMADSITTDKSKKQICHEHNMFCWNIIVDLFSNGFTPNLTMSKYTKYNLSTMLA